MVNKSKKVTPNKNGKYVVFRNGVRVSDSEYTSIEEAQSEYDHWNRVITRWPDGSKLEIVEI